ncbi:exopolysaccharide synthesis protein [Sulfitobacter sp. EhC04]|uniref:exopolysaccharide biosynthesis protein n=1 Tax=Sulfitobacter sp. EhC04 TaxID=1849168 RepID=UPI0007F5316E|nr:exopolysaccharide biosynthesis protein [Sulfitobacter sp. EhC04]OAN67851.1 exopolysaccharide synthesis protein [Sulfitobacter sp. EhC04]
MIPDPEPADKDDENHTLSRLLDGMDHAARRDTVSVQDVLTEFGDRTITPFILLIAVLLVSPISGIPGMPTIAASIIVIMSVQALSGRRRLWLPGFLLRRTIASDRLRKAVSWMRKPCAFLDRHSQQRLVFLTRGPMRWITLAACAVIPLGWPPLEVLPMVSSIGGGTVALLAYGLYTKDGVYVLLGYIMIALSAGAILSFWP